MTQGAINYAKALFDLGIQVDCVKGTEEIIRNSRELAEALSNPAVKKKEKHAVIEAVFDERIRSFLKVLCDNEAMGIAGEIFDAYNDISLNSQNIIKATITYMTRPDDDQLEEIKKMVCRKFNKSGVLLELKEDPTLLGGFILTVGNTEYDKSIRGALEGLGKTLVRR